MGALRRLVSSWFVGLAATSGLAMLIAGCTFSPSLTECESDDDCASLELVCNVPLGYCVPDDRMMDARPTVDASDDTADIVPVGCGTSGEDCPGSALCCATDGGECAPGQPDCGCVDPRSDLANCGACGNGCGPDQLCVLGVCQCPAGYSDCDDDPLTCEVDNLDNDMFCGDCATQCTQNAESCSDGACLCDGRQCDTGATCCAIDTDGDDVPDAPVCVDSQRSVDHCGGCNIACGDGESCVDGVCTCGSETGDNGAACTVVGETCCGEGNEQQCVDAESNLCVCGDPAGNTFCMMGERCCSPVPDDGDELNDVCIPVRQNPNNCGGCGIVCDPPRNACLGGVCQCPAATPTFCDTDPVNPVCADTQQDNNHCGACGNACSAGETCCGGECVDLATDVNHCGVCSMGCNPGQPCLLGECGCDSGQINDDQNCGSCDNACMGGRVCTNDGMGTFTCQCPAGQTDCGGTCVDLQESNTHCGACNMACTVSNGSADCNAGVCERTCNADRGDCDGDPTTCEVDLTVSSNCGGCGVTCVGQQTCTDTGGGNYACQLTCTGNTLDCDGDPNNGCETQTRDDDSCGNSCDTIVDCGTEEDEGCNSNGTCDCRSSQSGSDCSVVGEACEASSGADDCFCGGDGASLQCAGGQICIHDGLPNNPSNFRCVTP